MNDKLQQFEYKIIYYDERSEETKKLKKELELETEEDLLNHICQNYEGGGWVLDFIRTNKFKPQFIWYIRRPMQ